MSQFDECPKCRKPSLAAVEIDRTFKVLSTEGKAPRNIHITGIPASACRECDEIVFDGVSHNYIDAHIKAIDAKTGGPSVSTINSALLEACKRAEKVLSDYPNSEALASLRAALTLATGGAK